MANYFFPPLVFSYRLFVFTNCGNFQARTRVCRKFAAENRVKEGIGQESNGAANQENKFSYFARSRLRLRPQEIWELDYERSNLLDLEEDVTTNVSGLTLRALSNGPGWPG